MEAAKRAETFFFDKAREVDTETEEAFERAGVEVVHLSDQDLDAWRAVARETSYKLFAEEVDGGQRLLDEALAVE